MKDIKDIPNFVPETDPLFGYIHKVANHFWLFYDPDIQEFTFSSVPHHFYVRYCNGNINTDYLFKYETCTEVLDTLKAFSVDQEMFWYLCLLIKDYVEGETTDTFVRNPTHREELESLILEIEKLKPIGLKGLYRTECNGELTFKVSKHAVRIRNSQTLLLIKLAIEEYLERNPENTIHLDSAPVNIDVTTTLADGYRIYLFDRYLSWFLKDLKADKYHIATGTKNDQVSTDKKLLISRMLYVLGITDDKNYYEEYDKDGHKYDKLKNTLKNYRGAKVLTHNRIYW